MIKFCVQHVCCTESSHRLPDKVLLANRFPKIVNKECHWLSVVWSIQDCRVIRNVIKES